jgi:dTDP-4-dehydrorhamnose 3,5-epimerase
VWLAHSTHVQRGAGAFEGRKKMTDSTLERTLAAAKQSASTVAPDGGRLTGLIDGVRTRSIPVHTDERGTVVELYDTRWNWHPDPLVFVYSFTIRPGWVKGWGLHKLHDDRYVILQGEVRVVLYDLRPESPTCGQVSSVVLSEHGTRLLTIPKNVWHADHNIGSRDAVVVNFPTTAYDHAEPDKYCLPLDTPLIPYNFQGARGWG